MELRDMSTEEILQRYPKWRYDRTDRNQTRYFIDSTCHRCGGKGVIPCYGYIEGGLCFECGGSGLSKGEVIKVYTAEHEAKLAAQREQRAIKRAQERKVDFQHSIPERIKALGFSVNGVEFVTYRVKGNTYAIKDTLKALGCKFCPEIGWHSAEPLADYDCQIMTSTDLLIINDEACEITWRPKQDIEMLFDENKEASAQSTSEWQGAVDDRIEVEVTIDNDFTSQFTYNSGYYGAKTSHLYLMHDSAGNIYKWNSSAATIYEVGKTYKLRATVKDHTEYKGIKQTVLTRAKCLV